MQRLIEGYIRHTRLIGALYSIIPTLAGFTTLLVMNPFREVYLVRLLISIVLGGLFSAFLHSWGVGLFLAKHRSKEGPATLLDGTLIGAGIGFGSGLITPLTTFIQSGHMEMAKWIVIGQWSLGLVIGGIVGTLLALGAITHLDRN